MLTTDAPITPATPSAVTRPHRGYKWIAKEIERLDPEVDYARIWALTATYQVDEVFFNLQYALGLPCITQNPHGSALLAKGTRKAVDRRDERAHDTLSAFWQWYEFGPENIDVQRSLERVNRIHEALSKHSPDAFPDEDYVYTTCMLGTTGHALRLKLGLSGFTQKQHIATHHFWRSVTMKMRGPNGYVEGYPDDFAGMLEVVRQHEAKPWPCTESGRMLAEYTNRQFCEANFPKPMQWLGRQLLLTLQKPHIRRLHQMGEPNPVLGWLLKRGLSLRIWVGEHLLPDPQFSVPERARLAGQNTGQHQAPPMVAAEEVPFQQDGKTIAAPPASPPPASPIARCPFH